MFGKKQIIEKPKELSKEEQLGAKPDDIANTEPLTAFQILLRHSLPSIEITAHAHDFGEQPSCDGGKSGRFTHFIVRGDTTHVPYRRHVGTERTGNPYLSNELYRWEWRKDQPVKVVFSIRTDDVVMVVAKDNVTPVDTETLALEPRPQPEPIYAQGGFISRNSNGGINVSLDID